MGLLDEREQVASHLIQLGAVPNDVSGEILAIAIAGVLMLKSKISPSAVAKALQLLKDFQAAQGIWVVDGVMMAVPKSPTEMTFLDLRTIGPFVNPGMLPSMVTIEFNLVKILEAITKLLLPKVA